NSAATSGSRTTMFVPSRKRWAYLPRTPPVKSYSGRRSSLESEGLSVFFIGLTLTARRRSGVDNANLITPFCMRNYHETPPPGTDRQGATAPHRLSAVDQEL